MANIHWARVYERYQASVQAASEPFGVAPNELTDATLIDVRRAAVFQQAQALIAGARWHDPAAVADWVGQVAADRPVVVYCVRGHEVSRATALRLRSQGIAARFLRGGIEGWQDSGRPLQPKQGDAHEMGHP